MTLFRHWHCYLLLTGQALKAQGGSQIFVLSDSKIYQLFKIKSDFSIKNLFFFEATFQIKQFRMVNSVQVEYLNTET